MTNRSECQLTEIMERYTRTVYERQREFLGANEGTSEIHPRPWAELETFQKSQIKQDMLAGVMSVLNVVDEVETEARESRKAQRVPVEQPFEAGYGRMDLDMLHQVVEHIDNGIWDVEDVRNNVAGYINARPDDRNL